MQAKRGNLEKYNAKRIKKLIEEQQLKEDEKKSGIRENQRKTKFEKGNGGSVKVSIAQLQIQEAMHEYSNETNKKGN